MIRADRSRDPVNAPVLDARRITDFVDGQTRSRDPICSAQTHLRYLIKRGFWAAIDGNYWYGGKATIDGVGGDDLQSNSRVGLTVSWNLGRGHNLRFAASRGAHTRIGGDFDSLGISYGYSWSKRPAP